MTSIQLTETAVARAAAESGALTTSFPLLPKNARVWLFSAPRAFTDDERARIASTFDTVMGKWVVKQERIRGCWSFVEDRFVLVGADETPVLLDGCSVDAMMSWVARIERELGLRLVDRALVHYRDRDGAIQSLGRGDFVALYRDGKIADDTPVFDTAISRVDALRDRRFELPLGESWHARLVG